MEFTKCTEGSREIPGCPAKCGRVVTSSEKTKQAYRLGGCWEWIVSVH